MTDTATDNSLSDWLREEADQAERDGWTDHRFREAADEIEQLTGVLMLVAPPDNDRSTPPIKMVCEGSGQPAHPGYGPDLITGICSMCGHTVTTNSMIALLHDRDDLLAMIERGDFDA